MKRYLAPLVLLAFPILLLAQPKLQLVNWASGFDRPVDITHCGDSRIFVVEQDGIIWTYDSLGNRLDTFLYIDPRVNSSANEQGLLGLAFHPQYAENGYFFVYYTKNNGGATQVSRFSVRPNNPNEADPDSELSILTTPQPYNNHNGGSLKFGPDGHLYIGLGDGGSGGDPQGNGQKKTTFLGKILRINVDNSSLDAPYEVPADNPFVGQSDYLSEIWSLGWRNPWRFSFDRLTGDMWVGDVGQNAREEVDFELAGMGGLNYGWRCYEGSNTYNTANCESASAYVQPAFSYVNPSIGCSITGGFIYRGQKYPDLYGIYLNADYCSGRIWGTRRNANGTFSTTELANLGDYEFSTFGEGKDGELYVGLLSSGRVQRITELCSPFQVTLGPGVSPVCAGSLSGILDAVPVNGSGNISYAWSNGQTTNLNVYLNPGTYTVTVTNGNGCSRTVQGIIEQMGPEVPTLSAADTIVCFGQPALLTAGNLLPGTQLRILRNGVIVYDEPVVDTVFSLGLQLLSDATYQVQVSDTICVQNSQLLNISIETAIEPEVTQISDTLFAVEPCVNCQWLLNGQPIPGATGQFHVPTVSGVYELQVTSDRGCVYESSGINIVISEAPYPASVKQFSLTPNPTQGMMQLELTLNKWERFNISLTDIQQRQIFYQTHQADKLSLPVDLRGLPAGTYWLKIQTESGSMVRKVVKQ